jgi:outer membrane protein OmpA-like peptidoglycan-associated protein
VGTIRTGIDYEVSFDLKLHGSVADWGSIVHFTATGANCDGYGSRIPGIWTNPGQTTLHTSSGHEGNGNDNRSTRALIIDSEVKVRLRVQGTACTVWFDGEKVLDEPTMMGKRQEHEDVKVYVGDPWYEPANGELRNLQYWYLSAAAPAPASPPDAGAGAGASAGSKSLWSVLRSTVVWGKGDAKAKIGKEAAPPPPAPPAPAPAPAPPVIHKPPWSATLSAEERLAQLQIEVMKKIGDKCPHLKIDLVARSIDLTDMINFTGGTADVLDEDMGILAEAKFAIKAMHDIVEAAKIPKVHLCIEGHVHKTKNIERCWAISKQRAEVICEHIAEGGTPMDILHPKGYGASVPLGTPEENRRVHIRIMTDEDLANWAQDQVLAQLQIEVMKKIGDKCPHLKIDLVARKIDLTDMIKFTGGTADVLDEDMGILAEAKFAIKAMHDIVEAANLPKVHLCVEGHVHKIKDIERGWATSKRRAEVICQQIAEGGTPMDILHPKGYGASVPLGTPLENRRVHIRIMTDEELANWGS